MNVLCRFQEKDEYLMRLEKMINPLLDDDDLTALTYILSEIMEMNVKTMQAVLSIRTFEKKTGNGICWVQIKVHIPSKP
jgi:hypothetical protein